MSQLLKVDNIKKIYGKSSLVTKALNGVSFSVDKGEFTAIMGSSGSGKTTLLNCISTIDSVTSGNIYIDDENITNLKQKQIANFRRTKIGFIFQDFNLLDTLTIGENISLSLSINKINPENIDDMVYDIVKKLNIEEIIDKYPYEVSGGQKQRCACARALINNPSIILADEPTGALDTASSRALLQTLSDMNEKLHSTILMVTHDAFSASYCKRILFLKDGQLFTEIVKGNKTKKELLNEILDVLNVFGGEEINVN